MTRPRTIAAASALVLTHIGGAQADPVDCAIERAVFAERQSAMELRFRPTSGENTPLSHGFELVADDLKLVGHVMFDEAAERPEGMMMHNCPEGDATGSDIAACTVWSGFVYAAYDNGDIELLPSEGAKAPPKLLLPGFGPAFKASSIGNTLSAIPWDVFEFKHCMS